MHPWIPIIRGGIAETQEKENLREKEENKKKEKREQDEQVEEAMMMEVIR